MNDFVILWSYLSATPLLWLTATIAAYLIAESLTARLEKAPLGQPTIVVYRASLSSASLYLYRLRHLFRRRTIYPFSSGSSNGHFGPAALGQLRHDPKIRYSHPIRAGRRLYGGGRINHYFGPIF